MLTHASGPFAQQTSRRAAPAIPQERESFLGRGILTASHHGRAPAVLERLQRLQPSRSLTLFTANRLLMPDVGLVGLVVGEDAGISEPDIPELLQRQVDRPSSVLAERPSVGHPRHDAPATEADVQPFALALKTLLESEQLTPARRMLDAAPAHILTDPLVARMRALLAPPVVKRVERRDSDRSQEYRWLRTEAPNYRGRWVALDGERVVASAESLSELREALKTLPLPRAPLLHRID
jgi:hypothetical protein